MRRLMVGVSAAVFATVVGVACVAVFHANRTLTDTRLQVGEEGKLAFRVVSWGGSSAQSAFEAVRSPMRYTAGAAFAGKLYLGGAGGLAVVEGAARKELRVGVELPAAPVVALAAGRLRSEAKSSLMAATRGEGLLLVGEDSHVRQVLPAEAAARDVTAVLPLASGAVLLGTRTLGVLVFDGKTLRSFGPGLGSALAGLPVTALAGDEGDFWVGTRTRGVLHWHAGQVEAFDTSAGLPDAQVEDIAVAPEGVFVGTPLGVAEFVGGRFERVLGKGLFAHRLAVREGALVVATIDQGVQEIALRARAARVLPVGFERASAAGDPELNASGFFMAKGSLLAVSGEDLLRYGRGGSWQTVTAEPKAGGLADRDVAALNFGPDGRLWVGYFDRGLDVLDLASGRAEHVEDDHVFCVNRIVNDPVRHTVDVATANGLVLFDGAAGRATARQVLTRRDGLIADQVTDVAFSREGMALATPAGLTFLTAAGAQSLYAFQGLVNNHVYTLAAEASDDRVLAGTLGGLSILEDGAVRQNVTLKNSGLKRNWITAIAVVSEPGATVSEPGAKTWFVGTYGGGVVRVDAAGRVEAMEQPAPEAVINPNAMLVTGQHVLAGSLADGLLVYDRVGGRWSRVTAGLPSVNVTALAERGGQVYVGTANGLVRIAETRLP